VSVGIVDVPRELEQRGNATDGSDDWKLMYRYYALEAGSLDWLINWGVEPDVELILLDGKLRPGHEVPRELMRVHYVLDPETGRFRERAFIE
jgi:hypothetical protein